MRNRLTVAFCLLFVLGFSSCSPREVLSRRLAADLIRGSSLFKTPQRFWLRTGVVSNKDYLAPEYLLLQHHGWTTATAAPCPPQLAPPPCWDVVLTPSGVDTIRGLITPEDADKPSFNIPAARRELLQITGISKHDNLADVEFTWKWVPLNEIGAAIYPGDLHYRSTVGFRDYDDGWRLTTSDPHPDQTLEDALKNAEPAQ